MRRIDQRGVVQVVTIACILAAPLWIVGLFFSGDYEFASSLVLVPAVVLLVSAGIVHATRKEPFLRSVMFAGLLLRMAAAGVYLFLVFRVYHGGDVLRYFEKGAYVAEQFLERGQWVIQPPFWGTTFVELATAGLFILIGPSYPTGALVFAMLAFWGCYFAYRAFCLARPQGDHRTAAALIFLMPSVAFWPGTIGKEPLMALFVGMAALGFARLLYAPGPRAYVLLALGLGGAMAVRPHIAAMVAIAMVVPYLLCRQRRGLVGLLAKMAGIPLLVAGTYYLGSQAQEFLSADTLQSSVTVLERIGRSSAAGGSEFASGRSVTTRLLTTPFVLFRPFPWEAHNLQAAISSLEALLLLWLMWKCRGSIIPAVRAWRWNPFTSFILLYGALFSATYAAAISNFGILVRQRTMLLPYLLMLYCIRGPEAQKVQRRAMPPVVAPVRVAAAAPGRR